LGLTMPPEIRPSLSFRRTYFDRRR
jgi:hypothetical protein